MTEYLTTQEVADLLRLKPRKVYDLANSGALPCSRATGKLLFPAEAIRSFVARHLSGTEQAAPRREVVLGSHDPLLEWALRSSQCGLATFFDGSGDGLERFAAREGLATGLHIRDAASGTWNVAAVRARLPGVDAVLVEWARRQRGLVLAPELRRPVRGIADLRGLVLAPRQPEAGAQHLLLSLLAQAGVALSEIGLAEVARSETDAVQAVLEGKAEATLGLGSIAALHGLRFVPVMDERFDLLIDRRAWFEPPMQKFWAFCRSDRFRARAAELRGYDISRLGAVVYNG
jgi:excisionase family DNA binding protein